MSDIYVGGDFTINTALEQFTHPMQVLNINVHWQSTDEIFQLCNLISLKSFSATTYNKIITVSREFFDQRFVCVYKLKFFVNKIGS